MVLRINDTRDPEYQAFKQETNVAYSELFRNLETGLLVGNFCGDSVVNITGNSFNLSLNTAIEVSFVVNITVCNYNPYRRDRV